MNTNTTAGIDAAYAHARDSYANTRVQLPKRVGGYAIVKAGQSSLDAISKSIARRLGGGASLHGVRELGRNVVGRDDRVVSREYQFTFVYPEVRRGGGHPVAGEYHMTIDEPVT